MALHLICGISGSLLNGQNIQQDFPVVLGRTQMLPSPLWVWLFGPRLLGVLPTPDLVGFYCTHTLLFCSAKNLGTLLCRFLELSVQPLLVPPAFVSPNSDLCLVISASLLPSLCSGWKVVPFRHKTRLMMNKCALCFNFLVVSVLYFLLSIVWKWFHIFCNFCGRIAVWYQVLHCGLKQKNNFVFFWIVSWLFHILVVVESFLYHKS